MAGPTLKGHLLARPRQSDALAHFAIACPIAPAACLLPIRRLWFLDGHRDLPIVTG